MTPERRRLLDLAREMIAVGELSPTVGQLARVTEQPTWRARADIMALIADGSLVRGPGRPFKLELPPVPDLAAVPTTVLAGELARRGQTLAALEPRERIATGFERTCAADTCGAAVKRGHLMCRTHWFALPEALRARILRTHAAARRTGGIVARDAYQRAVTEARDLIDSGDRRARA